MGGVIGYNYGWFYVKTDGLFNQDQDILNILISIYFNSIIGQDFLKCPYWLNISKYQESWFRDAHPCNWGWFE